MIIERRHMHCGMMGSAGHLEPAGNVKMLLHVSTQNLADAHEADITVALRKSSCVGCLQNKFVCEAAQVALPFFQST